MGVWTPCEFLTVFNDGFQDGCISVNTVYPHILTHSHFTLYTHTQLGMSISHRVGLFNPARGLSAVTEKSSDTTGQGTSGFVRRVVLHDCLDGTTDGVAKQSREEESSHSQTATTTATIVSSAWLGAIFRGQALFGPRFLVPGTSIRLPLRAVDGPILLPVGASLTPVPGASPRTAILFKAGSWTIHDFCTKFEQLHPGSVAVAHLVHDMTCILVAGAYTGMLPSDLKSANMVLHAEPGSRPVVRGIDIDSHVTMATHVDDPLSAPVGTSWRNARTTPNVRAPTTDHVGLTQYIWSLGITVLGLFAGGYLWTVPSDMMNGGVGGGQMVRDQDFVAWSATVLSLLGGTRFSSRFTGDVHDDPEAYAQIADSILRLSPRLRSTIAMDKIAVGKGDTDRAAGLEASLWLLDFLVLCLTPYAVINNVRRPDASGPDAGKETTIPVVSVFNLLQHPMFKVLPPEGRFVPSSGV